MSKKNLILGGVFLALVVSAYIYTGPIKKWQKNSDQDKNFLAQVEADKITKIEITRAGITTTLEKQGEKFKIFGTKDFYVDETTASALKTVLEEAKKGRLEIISKNKDKKKDFQVDDETGVKLSLFQDYEKVAELVVGKATSDFAGSFISQVDINKTYSINAKMSGIFNRPDWYDYKIFTADDTAINKIRFQYPTREFTIEKKTDSEDWQGTLPYSFSVTQEKIKSILDTMSSLKATEIPEQDFAKTGLDKHLIIIQATGAGIDNTLMIGDDNGNSMYYAKRGDSDSVYLISKEVHDNLDRQIGSFK